MPGFGFNTDVKGGKTAFPVQTEDRGAGNPVLDTTIYLKGRVLAKRSTSYQEFLASPDFNQSELHAMLERQHKQFIEEIRAGKLAEMAQLEPQPAASGISVQLLNPATFLKGTTASLEVGVTRRGAATPVAQATGPGARRAGNSSLGRRRPGRDQVHAPPETFGRLMQVTLNGESRELPDNLTLQDLLQRLQLDADRVAVEHNREIIKRDLWASVRVQAGDQLEIVHLVGGG